MADATELSLPRIAEGLETQGVIWKRDAQAGVRAEWRHVLGLMQPHQYFSRLKTLIGRGGTFR
jgi:hypothetical protein